MYKLTHEGIKKCQSFIAECEAKRKEILDARLDSDELTTIPSIEDIESDINGMGIDQDGDYYNSWGVTDNYNSDKPIGLTIDIDFIEIPDETTVTRYLVCNPNEIPQKTILYSDYKAALSEMCEKFIKYLNENTYVNDYRNISQMITEFDLLHKIRSMNANQINPAVKINTKCGTIIINRKSENVYIKFVRDNSIKNKSDFVICTKKIEIKG